MTLWPLLVKIIVHAVWKISSCLISELSSQNCETRKKPNCSPILRDFKQNPDVYSGGFGLVVTGATDMRGEFAYFFTNMREIQHKMK